MILYTTTASSVFNTINNMSTKSSKQTSSTPLPRKRAPAPSDADTSSSSERRTESDKSKPCFAFFKKDDQGGPTCLKGDRCKYSHKPEAYMESKGLKKCPNCENLCKKESKQCRTCVEQWLELKEEEKLRRRAEEKMRYDEFREKKRKEKEEQWASWQEEVNSRPEQQCRGGKQRTREGELVGNGFECNETTKFDLCKSCYDEQRRHRAPRYNPMEGISVTVKSSQRRNNKNFQKEEEPEEEPDQDEEETEDQEEDRDEDEEPQDEEDDE